ncbi:CLUMA_CG016859, isoform A [Clunio marinus]|uniref:CLUMA_CG016859, isoform A n=1 Tax=Clunio marinus TaxID=568069 RepID=A0A1J1IVS8_9DIPT|nr:CLUMA_CG016859, isoform A [Clunio marinus]
MEQSLLVAFLTSDDVLEMNTAKYFNKRNNNSFLYHRRRINAYINLTCLKLQRQFIRKKNVFEKSSNKQREELIMIGMNKSFMKNKSICVKEFLVMAAL